jgi:hypothetical protein
LISKVNSDWINEVLINPELDRAGPDHDAVVGELPRQSSRKQATPVRRDPVPPAAANWTKAGEPGITVESIARPSRHRSVARRIKERLALAVAALIVAWLGLWMVPAPQDVTGSVSVHETNASPEPAPPINTTELRPAWLLPEILYGPAMARSIPVPGSGR